MRTEGHLGGYVVGGDPATIFPDLWAWMIEGLGVRSVLDVGCGEGLALSFFRDIGGCEVLGVDGVRQADPDIMQHDFNDGPWDPDREFDLVWCCEFVEYVDECFLPNMLPALTAGRLLAMTHAFPGQGGHHHVNCRTPDYWLGALAAAGMCLDDDLTSKARLIAGKNPSPWNHFIRSGLVLHKPT